MRRVCVVVATSNDSTFDTDAFVYETTLRVNLYIYIYVRAFDDVFVHVFVCTDM